MVFDSQEAHLIKHDSLAAHDVLVDSLLKSVEWHAKRGHTQPSNELEKIKALITDGHQQQSLSIAAFAIGLGESKYLMPEGVNKALLIVRNAIRVGKYVSDQYAKASSIDLLRTRSNLSAVEQSEFTKKSNTASAVFAFVSAYYVLFELSQYKPEQVSNIQMDMGALPELSLTSPGNTRNCIMFYYAAFLEKSGLVQNELDFIKLTLLYFESIIDEIKLKAESLEYTAPFESQAYKLEGSEFSLSGFEVNMPGQVKQVEFNKVHWGDIVGNTVSKHSARRTIMQLLCYDIDTQRNPMKDLGALTPTKMTYGPPGTGKSLEIAAIATELQMRCQELSIPFLFSPFPDNIISSFQGESAERMIAWMKPLQDPSKIIFAPIDDAENNLEERSNDGVSAGVKAVVGVFLRMTEGAYAIHHGNTIINLYTNLPEKIDRAVLSRIQSRTSMDGAVSVNDFLDQDYIGLMRELNELVPGFNNLKAPAGYQYMSDQDVRGKIESAYQQRREANVPKIAAMIEQVRTQYEPNQHAFFAHLDVAVKQAFPNYTSRDKRNIQSAVKNRLFDFDFPEQWLSTPDTFYRQDYETKKAMIIEIMRGSLGGKSFADIYLEEATTYFCNLAAIADKDFERQVEQSLHLARIQREAAKRMTQ